VRAIRLTRGAVVAVPDEAILDAQDCIKRAGVGCEPASAASVAGVRAAVTSGLIGRDESVVAILTGHLLKDPNAGGAARNHQPIEVDATLDAVERALS
jgi:threonine synthase